MCRLLREFYCPILSQTTLRSRQVSESKSLECLLLPSCTQHVLINSIYHSDPYTSLELMKASFSFLSLCLVDLRLPGFSECIRWIFMPCMSVAISVSFVCPGSSRASSSWWSNVPRCFKMLQSAVCWSAALKNKATFYPFPDPKRGKFRSALARPATRKNKAWNKVAYTRHSKKGGLGKVRLDQTMWRRSLLDILHASGKDIVKILLQDGFLK